MAHRKAGGTAKNLRDSQPKFLGIKLFDGELARSGAIILRQRGTNFIPGKNTRLGRDHTIFALTAGRVQFRDRRKVDYDSRVRHLKEVSVV